MSVEKEKFPAPSYTENVLADCFEDAKHFFLEALVDVDHAHAIMLAEQGIITDAELKMLLNALSKLDLDEIRAAKYDGSYEDLFFLLQREIAKNCADKEVAGKLHTARSRNDIDVTIYRLHLRKVVLKLLSETMALRGVMLDLASQHHETLIPAYTHTQPAQPSTLAHFLLAIAENLGRDVGRLQRAFENMNFSPLGACAITTTGFPISRERTADLLGFSAPTVNSYASIASIDYFTELLGAVSALLVNVGKFAQEFLLMAMQEFDVIVLSDGYVQGSSIMPQKRNPVAIEHVRAIASKGLGQALGVLTAVHNTPFGDINDSEDDIQPLIAAAVRDATRAVSLLSNSMRAATFKTETLRRRAEANFITVTELADTIVRSEGLSFHISHKIVGTAVRAALAVDKHELSPEIVQTAANEVLGRPLSLTDEDIAAALSAENFVNIRTIYGGTAPEETRRALAVEKEREAADEKWLEGKRAHLSAAASSLKEKVAAAIA
ncbi:MAG: argininosuccinate lyase [Acidobacteria bacterium OLB17]|nr:MAG: argininosuccinate lyase [Acidobacteria bacterium OLB17]MCZ2391260.1 argininosuccinate lyase [Acidobacteriota bacterium]